MKVIYANKGGGYKGVISAAFGFCLERALEGDRLIHIVDMFSGCSTGSLQAGSLALGIPYSSIFDMYTYKPEEVFVKTTWPWQPKYRKDKVVARFKQGLGTKPDDMHRTLKMLQINAVDSTFGEGNVYFKSWKPKCQMPVSLACQYSFSAPYYFGASVDELNRKVYLDGGTGNSNSTLSECIIEAQKLGWLGKEKVLIINVGTGYTSTGKTFDKAKADATGIAQNIVGVLGFLNMARRQSDMAQILGADMIKAMLPGMFDYVDVDMEIPEELDKMDAIKEASAYHNLGVKLWKSYKDEVMAKLSDAGRI